MPIDAAAGYSDDTGVKQRDFEYVLRPLLAVARSCMKQSWAHSEFYYLDLNPGPGIVGGHEGSPIIFLRTALSLGLPFRAFFFEKDEASVYRLREAAERACPPSERWRVRVVLGDHGYTVAAKMATDLAELPKKWVYGLAYADPNGMIDLPLEPMASLAERFPQMDQLVNISATTYKRVRLAGQHPRYLLGDLKKIKKSVAMVREPVGRWQWTMVFLTNWAKAPEYKRAGFWRIDTPEGRDIVDRVNFSKSEREAGRTASGPFGANRPTGAMRNTFGTPDSLPFGLSFSSGVAASASAATRPVPLSRTT